VNFVKNPARMMVRAALLALAMPISALAAAPFSFPMQFPSAATPNVVPPALQPALDQALAQDPDATWLEQKIVSDDGQADDLFGFRVLVSGDTAFISAPAPIFRPGKVYVFVNSGGAWTQTQTLAATPSSPPPPGWSDFFGWSLSLSGDSLLIGAPFMLDQTLGPIGAAYVFTQSGGTWTQTQELTASDAAVTDYFGWSVKHVGDTAVIGANSHNRGANGTEGAAYIFVDSGGSWSQTQELEPSDGTPGDGRQFGNSVAFDGTTMLIGAPSSDYNSTGVYIPGEAYVFTNSGGTWTESQILQPDDSADGDQFGYSLAISGTTLLIGAPAANIGANVHQGAAYVFDGSSGPWTQTNKLVAADGVAYDQFGQSVAMQDTNALIGGWSHNDDPNGPPATPKPGSVYLYTAARGSWSLSDTFTASDATDGDSYGWDVAIDGTTLLVGAQGTVDGNAYQGAAYFYVPADPPIAVVSPSSLSFSLAPGAQGSQTLTIGNTGGSTLSYAFAEAPAGAPRVALNLRTDSVSSSANPASHRTLGAIGASRIAGPRPAAPWAPRDADGALSFVVDDGTYEDSIGLNDQSSTEFAAIWLNRFSPPAGTGAFTIDSISILWPDNANGTLVGNQVDLVAYYDADGDGDPSNAVRLGGDNFVTIASLDTFLDYTVNFSVPGDGDVYVGFENTYALGGSSPILFPAAIDEDSGSQGRSFVAGMSTGDPDADNLANNDLLGTIDGFGLPGNWLIRATGATGGGCSSPSDVPWLSEAPANGTVDAGLSQDVAVTADATGLDPGNYSALLCLTTDDPNNGLIQVPVSLSVTPDDTIFRDGFDGTP
jgi:hypothetical protein